MMRRFCSGVNGMSGPLLRVRRVPGRGIRTPPIVAILARVVGTSPRRRRWSSATARSVSLGPAEQEVVDQLAVEGAEEDPEVRVTVREAADLGPKVDTLQLLDARLATRRRYVADASPAACPSQDVNSRVRACMAGPLMTPRHQSSSYRRPRRRT